jgi:hypothetical protein
MAKNAWHQQSKVKKMEYQGIKFDSKTEMDFYIHLQSGKYKPNIQNIIIHPKFILVPAFFKNGKKIQPITYVADFQIEFDDGSIEIIDVKGYMLTPDFKLKKKLFEYFYPHELKLIALFPKKHGGQFGDYFELAAIRKEESKNGPKAKPMQQKTKGNQKGK